MTKVTTIKMTCLEEEGMVVSRIERASGEGHVTTYDVSIDGKDVGGGMTRDRLMILESLVEIALVEG